LGVHPEWLSPSATNRQDPASTQPGGDVDPGGQHRAKVGLPPAGQDMDVLAVDVLQ